MCQPPDKESCYGDDYCSGIGITFRFHVVSKSGKETTQDKGNQMPAPITAFPII